MKTGESLKAELEYNIRAAEINVDILKHEMENARIEYDLLQGQCEK